MHWGTGEVPFLTRELNQAAMLCHPRLRSPASKASAEVHARTMFG